MPTLPRITFLCIVNNTIEDIQIIVMNMTLISPSEVKNIYFMSGEATNEIYIFVSLHEMTFARHVNVMSVKWYCMTLRALHGRISLFWYEK